ncbi:MAG: Gfo/Idh/MocA family oxidoreductase [Planctomycetes bacterium]|nr:Gfo/Idh/MocA family oxidoreductase [Planctomycetota bacterium]
MGDKLMLGVTGLGGWAGAIGQFLEGEAAKPNACFRFAAACEPDQKTHAARIAELRSRGITVVADIDALLEVPGIEAVWLPLPIDLHRPFTEKALAAGKAVICEKPAAGSVDDVDAMIAARDKARRPVAIAYQDVYDPTTLILKNMLLAGKIGRITHATVIACWPRTDQYYGRAAWAGKMQRNGTWVLDSPVNNACAHYVNIPLFLMGPTLETAAVPAAVEAELYRANPIENADTVSMRVTLEDGATLLVGMTHACETLVQQQVVIHGEKGTVVRTNDRIVIEATSGSETLDRQAVGDARQYLVRRFHDEVRGLPNQTSLLATLESARSQTVCVNAAAEASRVFDVPGDHVRSIATPHGTQRAISGIEAALQECVRGNRMLHETALLPWTRPAGRKETRGYRRFAGPAA